MSVFFLYYIPDVILRVDFILQILMHSLRDSLFSSACNLTFSLKLNKKPSSSQHLHMLYLSFTPSLGSLCMLSLQVFSSLSVSLKQIVGIECHPPRLLGTDRALSQTT